jgi:acyl-CoA thioesterase-2
MTDEADATNDADLDTALAQTLEFLTVHPNDEAGEAWIGEPPEWPGDYVFGGFVIAQAIIAATRTAPAGRRLHSLHAYYLRPVFATESISYRVREIREGRSFTSRHVGASQGGSVLELSCSFTADGAGYVYDLPHGRGRPCRGDLELVRVPDRGRRLSRPTPAAPDGHASRPIACGSAFPRAPDDEHLHTALLGFATDWTGIGGRPLHLEGDTTGMVSLDHAVWFHRPARADAWLFYDVHSLVNAGGRGLLRGVMRDPEGRVVISVVQEMRLTPIDGS